MSKISQIKSRTDIPVIAANKQGLVTYINPKFTKDYGWTETDLIGQPLTTIIPPALHDAHNIGFSRFILTEKPTLLDSPIELQIITKDGQQLAAEHTIAAEKLDTGWEFAATIRALTVTK